MKELINDKQELIVPKGLAVALLSIAFSATRGAMVAKSEENILSKAVMPLVDPKKLYENSLPEEEMDV